MSRIFKATDDTGDSVWLTLFSGTNEVILEADPLGVNLTPQTMVHLRNWLDAALVLVTIDDADQEELFQSSLYESQNRPEVGR